jgi:hypothetical protein
VVEAAGNLIPRYRNKLTQPGMRPEDINGPYHNRLVLTAANLCVPVVRFIDGWKICHRQEGIFTDEVARNQIVDHGLLLPLAC